MAHALAIFAVGKIRDVGTMGIIEARGHIDHHRRKRQKVPYNHHL